MIVKHNSAFICPHCGKEDAENPENYLMDTDNYEEIQCYYCEKWFSGQKEIYIQYVTYGFEKVNKK